ncbi:MAG: dihydrofolate reductase family protein [Propionibacteriaceae bacterium]
MAHEAEKLNPTWLFAMRENRPFVTWKFAATMDGHSAASDGSSAWITSARTRAAMGKLRSECGAVLVETKALLLNNTQLTARDIAGNTLPVPWELLDAL